MTNRPLLRSCLQLSVLAISAWMCMPMARAQTTAAYPNKPIKLIVPFPAGGGGDTLARLVMLRAAKELGQPIVVEAAFRALMDASIAFEHQEFARLRQGETV